MAQVKTVKLSNCYCSGTDITRDIGKTGKCLQASGPYLMFAAIVNLELEVLAVGIRSLNQSLTKHWREQKVLGRIVKVFQLSTLLTVQRSMTPKRLLSNGILS
jgi:hypothetical protein